MRFAVSHRRSGILILGLLSIAGCATTPSAASQTNAPIVAEELQESPATTVLAAVRELRPRWLNRIDGAFLDGRPVSVKQLQQEPLSGIAEIRMISAEQATARYGTRSLSGAYLDVTRHW